MTTEIALSAPVEALPEVPALQQAHSDAHLIDIWLHGRSVHTQRAYRADIVRFRREEGKPLPSVTVPDAEQVKDVIVRKELDEKNPQVPHSTATAPARTATDGPFVEPGASAGHDVGDH